MATETRFRTDLSGLWSFCIPDGAVQLRQVPGSYDCVGDSIYTTRITLDKPKPGRRTLLCFEGIAYEGTVQCNGVTLGEMLPYCYYEFDVTAHLQAGENEFTVLLKDLNAVFGPAEGWKSYSGIVRAVYLLDVPESRLADVFFTYKLSQGYTSAACEIPFRVENPQTGMQVRAAIVQNGRAVAQSALTDAAAPCVSLTLDAPLLWTPDTPYLYTLEFTLYLDGAPLDIHTAQVGFRELIVKGSKFYLNGEDFFFAGVCRHDIWTDEAGFTMTDEMIEQDMKMIKHMGANYVRLVHYPHDRRVVEAADRIGLFVSEEPGLWWSDLGDTNVTSRALKVLEKVIYRDRSHASIAFWLCFNECEFNEQFLRDAVAVARRCDPTRLISGANCNDTRDTKRVFDACGVDFYTLHPYGTHPTHVNGNTLEEACQVLSGKPVIFTEWGGYYVVENPALFADFCNTMKQLHRNKEPQPVLAGMSYWQWQDICEAQRGLPACVDGVLTEGLVTIDRKPKTTYFTFMQFLDELRRPEVAAPGELTVTGGGAPDGVYEPLTLPVPAADLWDAACAASKQMPIYHWKKERRITNGPVLPTAVSRLGALGVALAPGKPVVLGAQSGAYTLAAGGKTDAVWFVGQATMGKGYPLSGARGEEYGSYLLTFDDGSTQRVALRNGLESATVFGLVGPTRFDPQAAYASRAFSLAFDRNWEIYHANLLRVPTHGKTLRSITAQITLPDYFLLLYGITLER